MAIPLSAYDRKVIDAGYNYIPQTQYLVTPFQIPTIPKTTDPITGKPGMPINSSGILSLQPQGGGGVLQAGDINYRDFAGLGFDAFARRQPSPLVDDSYQSKLDKNFFGFPSYREQELTGPDMGEYIGSNTDVPLELTKAGRLQSGLSSIGKGITGLLSKAGGIGPISALLGSMDKFDTLPALDQQFIEQSMGYRGPTVFGENTGGNYVDPFGVNVRSAFGNYAEKVRDDYSSLKDSLTGRLSDKYGATFDEELGEFVGKGAKKANDMTKMIRSKFTFRNKQINQQKFDAKIADKARQKQRDLEIAAKKKRDAQAAIAAAERTAELNRRQAIADRQAAAGQTTSGGRGNYRSDRDNSRDGGYGNTGRDSYGDKGASRSRDNRSSDLGFSDIRLKENVELIGKSPSNINIYKFNYKDNSTTYQGAMAHEVPWASVKHDSGYMMVDYSKLDVDFKIYNVN